MSIPFQKMLPIYTGWSQLCPTPRNLLPLLGGENWAMMAHGKQPDGAWAFLKFVTDVSYGTKLTDCMGYIPSRKDVLAQVSAKSANDPTMQVFLKQMESAKAARSSSQLVRRIGFYPGSDARSVERTEKPGTGNERCCCTN